MIEFPKIRQIIDIDYDPEIIYPDFLENYDEFKEDQKIEFLLQIITLAKDLPFIQEHSEQFKVKINNNQQQNKEEQIIEEDISDSESSNNNNLKQKFNNSYLHSESMSINNDSESLQIDNTQTTVNKQQQKWDKIFFKHQISFSLGKDSDFNSYFIFKELDNKIYVINKDQTICLTINSLNDAQVLLKSFEDFVKTVDITQISKIYLTRLIQNLKLVIDEGFLQQELKQIQEEDNQLNNNHLNTDINKKIKEIDSKLSKCGTYNNNLKYSQIEDIFYDEDSGFRVETIDIKTISSIFLEIESMFHNLMASKCQIYASQKERKEFKNSIKQCKNIKELGDILYETPQKFGKVKKLSINEQYFTKKQNEDFDLMDLENMYEEQEEDENNPIKVCFTKVSIKIWKNWTESYRICWYHNLDDAISTENINLLLTSVIQFYRIIEQYVSYITKKSQKLEKQTDNYYQDFDEFEKAEDELVDLDQFAFDKSKSKKINKLRKRF